MAKKKTTPKKSEKFRKIIRILRGKPFDEEDVLTDSEYGATPMTMSSKGGGDEYCFDIAHRFYSGAGRSTVSVGGNMSDDSMEPIPMKDGKIAMRIAANPKDVVGELEKPPKGLSLEGLDEKILIVKDKAELVAQWRAKEELEGLLQCLENRKKYYEHSAFFAQFDTTTMESIDKLTSKYDLVLNDADIFIPEFPTEAVAIMKEYNKQYKKITDKKARFKVIGTSEDFKDADGKRDPILLAQSPFGFYFDILGAWDKEMLILSEL